MQGKNHFFKACLTLREHVLIHFHTIFRKDKRESYEMAPENINKENRIWSVFTQNNRR